MPQGTLPLSGRVRVLVVDDNEGFRGSLAALLGGEDLEVVGEASNGIEAIRLVNELGPDVVLMDVRMPQMDGIETTRRLKAQHPSLEVVALTGLEEERAVREMLVAGASGYVLKDSEGDEIIHAVRRAASGGALLSHGTAALSSRRSGFGSFRRRLCRTLSGGCFGRSRRRSFRGCLTRFLGRQFFGCLAACN